jgi:hypothetical protein
VDKLSGRQAVPGVQSVLFPIQSYWALVLAINNIQAHPKWKAVCTFKI